MEVTHTRNKSKAYIRNIWQFL